MSDRMSDRMSDGMSAQWTDTEKAFIDMAGALAEVGLMHYRAVMNAGGKQAEAEALNRALMYGIIRASRDRECWAQEKPDAEISLHLPNTWRGKVLEKLALDREPVEEYYDVYCPGDLFKGAPQMEDPESCLANAAGGKHDTTQCDKCWSQCAV